MLYEVAKGLIILGEERRKQWFEFLDKNRFKRDDYVHVISMFLEEDIDCNYEEMKLDRFIKFINNNINHLQKGDFFRENIADMFVDAIHDNDLEEFYKMGVVDMLFKQENLW